MLDLDKLYIGDVAYTVATTANILSRSKIYMVDADGVKWSRYPAPLWEYDVAEAVVRGKARTVTSGTIPEWADVRDELRFFLEGGEDEYWECTPDNNADWFTTREQAQEKCDQMTKFQMDNLL